MSGLLWQEHGGRLRQRLLAGTCSQADIAASCIERIEACESQVMAWAWHDKEQVLAAARQADLRHAQGEPLGPLAGFAVGIKDIIDTADMPTAYGAALYRGHRPARDAAVVARLRAAGALILGKTVTTEFAYAAPGPTRNPHAHLHTPGGSSSGSAAAVAAGMASVAISSQTGGSTIRPAAFCGVVGFKPTHGRIDGAGMKPLAPSSDTVGLHARSVADVARLFEALVAEPEPEPTPHGRCAQPQRVAWYPGPHAAQASAASHEMSGRLRLRLHEAGIEVVEPGLDMDMVARLGEENRLIMAVEASRTLAREYHEHRAQLTPQTIELIERGLSVGDRQYHAALAFVERSRDSFAHAMRGIDALLGFSAPGAAPLAASGTGSSLFNRPWSALGVPCLNLPCGSERGLPLGVQLVAPAHADESLLGVARSIEMLLETAVGGS